MEAVHSAESAGQAVPQPSPIDTERFGFAVARVGSLAVETLGDVLRFCEAHGIRMLIAHCDCGAHAALQAAQSEGFRIMDTMLAFERRFDAGPLPHQAANVEVRPIRPAEEHAVVELAALAFRNYVGHYQADSGLDPARSREAYPDWTRRLLEARDASHEMLVAELDGAIVGFHALEQVSDDWVHLPLSGVSPVAAGKRIYQQMQARGMKWAVARGARRMTGIVQLANTVIQRAYVRLGYMPDRTYYTLHRWFD